MSKLVKNVPKYALWGRNFPITCVYTCTSPRDLISFLALPTFIKLPHHKLYTRTTTCNPCKMTKTCGGLRTNPWYCVITTADGVATQPLSVTFPYMYIYSVHVHLLYVQISLYTWIDYMYRLFDRVKNGYIYIVCMYSCCFFPFSRCFSFTAICSSSSATCALYIQCTCMVRFFVTTHESAALMYIPLERDWGGRDPQLRKTARLVPGSCPASSAWAGLAVTPPGRSAGSKNGPSPAHVHTGFLSWFLWVIWTPRCQLRYLCSSVARVLSLEC